MAFFSVVSVDGGAFMGVFQGESAADALAVMHREAGYACSVVDGIIVADDAGDAGFISQPGESLIVEDCPLAAAWEAADRNPNTLASRLRLGQVIEQVGIVVCGAPEWRAVEKALVARGLTLEDMGGGQEQVVEA